MSFTLNCDFEAARAAARKRQREAIAASFFQKQTAADMKKPYYRIFVHLGGEVDDMQPPETFHSTALEAAKAVMDFLFGTYGYGEGTYEIDTPAWISDELCVPNDDDSPISCCVRLIGYEELAKLIQKDARGENSNSLARTATSFPVSCKSRLWTDGRLTKDETLGT